MTPQNSCVDLVVTAYNMEDCLPQCLDSIAAQSYRNFRALIIEDGSSDNTLAIAKGYAQGDERFHVIQTPNLGAAGARNKGIELVQNAYFMLLDGDDIFLPRMLETLHELITNTESDIAIGNITQFDHSTGERLAAPWALKTSQLPHLETIPTFSWHQIPGNLFAAFMGWPWDKLYRTELIANYGLSFPEDLANSEDMLFTYQALVLAKHMCVTTEILIEHRINRGLSVSNSRTRKPIAFYESLCRMKQFLVAQPDEMWEKLQQPYLNWALDWTLWNIETMSDKKIQSTLVRKLATNEFRELELDQHKPDYFTGYPRTMARYATVLSEEPAVNADLGPLGSLDDLPYGKFKPWNRANPFEKLVIRKRIRDNIPSEW